MAGDFTGDGISDLAVVNATGLPAFSAGESVTILLGHPDGELTMAPGSPVELYSGGMFASYGPIATGDFTHDGHLDLAVVDNIHDTVSILLGDGTGRFRLSGAPISFSGEQPNGIAVGDFNGDGNEDLAFASGGKVNVLLGHGAGAFAPAPGSPFAVDGGPNASPAAPGMPESIVAGDFNGDGNVDLAVANFNGSSDNVAVLQGDGHGGFTNAAGSPFPARGNPRPLVVGDFNGDGSSIWRW